MPHDPTDITRLMAQQDATGVAQPGVVPTDPPDGGRGFLGGLFSMLFGPTPETMEIRGEEFPVLSGGGALDFLGPETGGAALMASLPALGRAAGSATRNVADNPRFLERILEGADMQDVQDMLGIAESTTGRNASSLRARTLRQGIELSDLPLERSRLRGAAELLESPRGTVALDLPAVLGSTSRQGLETLLERTGQIDRAAIETLIEESTGFLP